MQALFPGCENTEQLKIPDGIGQENGNNGKMEKNEKLIEDNSLKMRLKVIAMELPVIRTYNVNSLNETENYAWKQIILNIETSMSLADIALDCDNVEEADHFLVEAEKLTYKNMKRIKEIIKKKTVKKEEVKKTIDEIQVPDYKSIVTVKGTKDDVINCILKAKIALDNGKYEKAESLLFKAERILPTKNAAALLQEVRVAKQSNQKQSSVKATNAEKEVKTFEDEESKSRDAAKCLIAFENVFSTGNLEKAVRMLNKAKRLDHSLNVEDKLTFINAAIANKGKEQMQKKAIETEKVAERPAYEAWKAFVAAKYCNATQQLLKLKPMINFESLLPMTRSKITKNEDSNETELKSVTEKSVIVDSYSEGNKHKVEPEADVTKSNLKGGIDCLYNTIKVHINEKKKVREFGEVENESNTSETSPLEMNSFFPKNELGCVLKSSTEEKIVIRKDTEKTNTNPDYDKYIYYFKKAQIAFQNRNILETQRLIKLAASYYSCKTAKYVEFLEKFYVEGQTRSAHEITTSETQFSCLADEQQAEIDKHIEKEREIYKVEETTKIVQDYDINKEKSDEQDNKYPNEDISSSNNNKPTSDGDTHSHFNCYDYLDNTNEANKADALKCIKIAQKAFEENQYDKAERFFHKSQRLANSQVATKFMETVQNAKSHDDEKTIVETEEIGHDNRTLNEAINEFEKCIEKARNAKTDNDLDKAEHFLAKAIRIHPKNEDNLKVKQIQDAIALQRLKNETNGDLQKKRETELITDLAKDAIKENKFQLAHHYLEQALNEKPNAETKHLLSVVIGEIHRQNGNYVPSKKDKQFESNRLLNKAKICIRHEDYERAESLLNISWNMATSRHTIIHVYEKLVNARLTHGNKINYKVSESDRIVKLALHKYFNERYKESAEFLKEALEWRPSVLTNKLLLEVKFKQSIL